eukprot:6775498-Prymnesium_polylepis.2
MAPPLDDGAHVRGLFIRLRWPMAYHSMVLRRRYSSLPALRVRPDNPSVATQVSAVPFCRQTLCTRGVGVVGRSGSKFTGPG